MDLLAIMAEMDLMAIMTDIDTDTCVDAGKAIDCYSLPSETT